MGLIVLCVLEEYFVHVRAGILEKFVGTVEDDQRNLAVAQNAQLVRFLHQPKFTFCKRNLKPTKNNKLLMVTNVPTKTNWIV